MDKRKLNKRREFSDQIKRKVVSEFRDGKYTVKELAPMLRGIIALHKQSTAGFINTLRRINLK